MNRRVPAVDQAAGAPGSSPKWWEGAGLSRARHLLAAGAGLLLFGVALWVLHRELAGVHMADVVGRFRSLPPAALGLALLELSHLDGSLLGLGLTLLAGALYRRSGAAWQFVFTDEYGTRATAVEIRRLNVRATLPDIFAAWINSVFLVTNLQVLLRVFLVLGRQGAAGDVVVIPAIIQRMTI